MREKEFIAEMREIMDEVTHGDMQSIVEAFTMRNGGNDDDILNKIYNDVEC